MSTLAADSAVATLLGLKDMILGRLEEEDSEATLAARLAMVTVFRRGLTVAASGRLSMESFHRTNNPVYTCVMLSIGTPNRTPRACLN